MNKYKIRGTFKYGKLNSGFEFIVILLLGIIMTIGSLVGAIFMWKENPSFGIGLGVASLILGIVFTYEIVKHCKHYIYVKKCLKDTIEKTTYIRFCEQDELGKREYRGIKISASFKYEKKRIKKHSVFSEGFRRYVDKEVVVLYSPLYDEVLLLK